MDGEGACEDIEDEPEAAVGEVAVDGRGHMEIVASCSANLGQKDKQAVHLHAPLPALANECPVCCIAVAMLVSSSASVGAVAL